MKQALTFDDVLILPNYSDIESRSTIDISTEFLGLKLQVPIISANMDYVTGHDMAIAMVRAGGFYVLHRFYESLSKWYFDIGWLNVQGIPLSISTGLRDPYDWGIVPKYITIDVAHGHHQRVADAIKRYRDAGVQYVIAGNVATAAGFRFLQEAGADAIKVGIGPGSVCTTRTVTGIGVPQLTAIMDCAEVQENALLIADGGIKSSGDIVKALAAGADAVMLGSMLAGTDETPGDIRTDLDGNTYKPYRGQSIFGVNASHYTVEGVEGFVKTKGPVAGVIQQLAGGIRSGLSYVGARNISELRTKAEFVQVSHSTHYETQTRVQLEI